MLASRQLPPEKVLDVVGQTAGLRALAAIGRAPRHGRREVTLARVAHAKRPGDEKLNARAGHGLAHGADFGEGQLTGGHDLRKPEAIQKGRLLRGADVALGGSVNFNVGQARLEQAEVLNDERVDPGLLGLVSRLDGRRDLVVVDERVEGHVQARAVVVRQVGHTGEVLKGVARGAACAEGRSPHVHGVGPVQDRRAGGLKVTGRGQKLQGRKGHRIGGGGKGRVEPLRCLCRCARDVKRHH